MDAVYHYIPIAIGHGFGGGVGVPVSAVSRTKVSEARVGSIIIRYRTM